MKGRITKLLRAAGHAVMNLFSGRRNPAWPITEGCIEAIEKKLADAKGRTGARPDRVIPNSGYRGMSVAITRGGRVQYYEIFHDTLQAGGRLLDGANEIGKLVFACMSKDQRVAELDGATYEDLHIEHQIWTIDGIGDVPVGLCCENAPVFHEAPAAFSGVNRKRNNCYNYGLWYHPNTIPGGAAVPGGLTGFLPPDVLQKAMVSDGLRWIGKSLPARCPVGEAHYIAVVTRGPHAGTKGDFHVLRLDRNGRWSHKDGDDPVTAYDGNGERIVDLSKAWFAWPSAFVGFFEVPKDVDAGPGR